MRRQIKRIALLQPRTHYSVMQVTLAQMMRRTRRKKRRRRNGAVVEVGVEAKVVVEVEVEAEAEAEVEVIVVADPRAVGKVQVIAPSSKM